MPLSKDYPATPEKSMEADLRCSFCGKSRKVVKSLIAGPSVLICDECVALCRDICFGAAPVPMTPGKAMEITAACVGHRLYNLGIGETKPPSLADYSLSELLEANRLVAEQNADAQPDAEGGVMLYTVCADRLVAAIYVAYHYEPREHGDGYCEPVISVRGRDVIVTPSGDQP